MKATKFIKKFQDLCNAHCEGGKCDGCPIGPDKQADVCGLLAMRPKTIIKLVKAWAKGHRTNDDGQDNKPKPEQGHEKREGITFGELMPLIPLETLVGLFQEHPAQKSPSPIVDEDSSDAHWPAYDADFDNSWQKKFYPRRVSYIRPSDGFIDIVLEKEGSNG